MKKRLVAIVCLIALLLSMTTLGTFSTSAEGDFLESYTLSETPDYSFAVIGDIQSLTEFDTHTGTKYLSTMFDWIINNKDARGIEYVFSLVDSVETLISWPNDEVYNASVNNPLEWQKAASQFKRLDGVIPYSVIRGNHDDEAGYHQYICTTDYKSQMDGFFYDETKAALDGNSMSNSYRKIEIAGQKYLMMTLDFDTNDDVIAWANNVISSNPDYRVIVSVHAYLNDEKGKTNYFLKEEVGQPGADNEEDGDENHDWFDFDGQVFWDEIFSKHANMFMVLSGHVRDVEDPVIRTRKATNGNHVFEVLVNPQTYDATYGVDQVDEETGDVIRKANAGGFVLMLNFSRNGNKIEFEYISTANGGKHFKAQNQTVKTVPGTSTLVLLTTVATTEAPADDTSKGGCGSAILSTVSVAGVIGTSLAAFAMRKRKENN